ncbi:MAG: metal-dependent hydrolase [Arhodomonas sp.]|nr:metal-dependent hydrolase [Arhodomonas sp.]
MPFGPWLAVVAGYASHPIADWMTPAGVEWLWPARWRCVLPGHERYRMRPMGSGELMFAAARGSGVCATAVPGRSAASTGGVITSAIGDIASARERYDAEKGRHRWTLEVEGRDNRSYADVSGRYPVIGEYGAGGFLVDGPDGAVTVCRADCDWYADSAVLERGESRETTSRRLAAERTMPARRRTPWRRCRAPGTCTSWGRSPGGGSRPTSPRWPSARGDCDAALRAAAGARGLAGGGVAGRGPDGPGAPRADRRGAAGARAGVGRCGRRCRRS